MDTARMVEQLRAALAEDDRASSRTQAHRPPQLLAHRCSTCVFRPGNPLNLRPGYLREIIDHNLSVGAALICHQTLPDAEHTDAGEAVCRGWYDQYGDRTTAIEVFERCGGIFDTVTLPGSS